MQGLKATCLVPILVLIAFGVNACSSEVRMTVLPKTDSYVQLAPETSFSLPGWSAFQPDNARSYMQDIQVYTEKHTGHLRGMLEINGQKFEFLAFDQFGRRALKLRWDNAGVHSQRADWLPIALRGEDVLGYIFLAFSDEDKLQKYIEPQGFVIVSEKRFREISANGQKIIRIEYEGSTGQNWPNQVSVRNFPYKLELKIQSVEVPS